MIPRPLVTAALLAFALTLAAPAAAQERSFEGIYSTLLDGPPARYGWLRASTWPASYTRWILRRLTGRAARAHNRPDTSSSTQHDR